MMSLHKANNILLGMVVTPVILGHGRLKQEDYEFLDNLSYIARLCLKNQNQNQGVRVTGLVSKLLVTKT